MFLLLQTAALEACIYFNAKAGNNAMVVFPDHDMNGSYFMYATEGLVQKSASYEKLKAAVKEAFEGGFDWHLKHRVDIDYKTQAQQYKSEAAANYKKWSIVEEEKAKIAEEMAKIEEERNDMKRKLEELMAQKSSSSSSSTSLSLTPYTGPSSSSSSVRQPASRPKPSTEGFSRKEKDVPKKRWRNVETSEEDEVYEEEEEAHDRQGKRQSPRSKAKSVGRGGKKQGGNVNKKPRR